MADDPGEWSPDDMVLADLSQFQEFGHLQEVNRAYFHPRGMALTLVIGEEGREPYLVVQSTDDPEGWTFDFLDDQGELDACRKARRVKEQLRERRAAREDALGYWIQPLSDGGEDL